MRAKLLIFLFFSAVITDINAQATIANNNPTGGAFLGWGDNTNADLIIRQNNMVRQYFTSYDYTTQDNFTFYDANRIFFGVNGNVMLPFSMLHLGENTSTSVKRSWMNIGTTYTGNEDIMHVGLWRQPDTTYGA